MGPIIIWLLAALALVLGFVYFIYLYFRENVVNAEGKGADKRMYKILTRYAMLRRFRVLKNLHFETKNGEVAVEQMLIGFFGILLVHTVGARGEFYGKLDEKQWVLVQDYQRRPFLNPYQEQQKAIAAIRPILSQNKIFNVPIEHIVVFTSISKKTNVFITFEDELLLRGKLKPYLERTKFDHDAEIDVEQVTALLEPYCRKKTKP